MHHWLTATDCPHSWRKNQVEFSPFFEVKQGGSHLLLGLLFSQLPCPLLGRERRGKHSENPWDVVAPAAPPPALTATGDQAEEEPPGRA